MDGRTEPTVDGLSTWISMVVTVLAAPSGLRMAAVMVGAAPVFAAAILRDAGEWQ